MIEWHFYRTLEPELATVWDEAVARYDAHPYQAAAMARVRAAYLGHGLGFILGYLGSDLVFGSAVFIRQRGPLPPHWVCSYGPWAQDAALLAQGIQDLVGHWPKAWRQPISLIVDPRLLPIPDDMVARLRRTGFSEQVPAEVDSETMCVDLTVSESEVWQRFRPTTRRMIRKAEAMGLRSRFGTVDDLKRFHGFFEQVVTASKRAAGYQVPPLDLLETLLGTARAWVVLTESGDSLVGGTVLARSQGNLHYLFGSRVPDATIPSLYHADWFAMRWAQTQGMRFFDFGTVPRHNEGLAHFKRRFGGQERFAMPPMGYVFQPLAQRCYLLARMMFR